MSQLLLQRLQQLAHGSAHAGGGSFLPRQGDPVRRLHLVQAGAVHLLRLQRDGTVLTLQRAQCGAIVAEASLFSPRYHCDALAVQDVRTLVVASSTLRAELAGDAALALAWAAHLAQEVQATRLRAEILALRGVTARLDAWLIWHEGRLPARGGWKTLATELGISPEALYRELSRRRKADPGQQAPP